MTLRRIGLMGGSFDPPHLAHRALGRVAREALALDELRWLPAGAPWQKAGREMASGADREAMVEALNTLRRAAGARLPAKARRPTQQRQLHALRRDGSRVALATTLVTLHDADGQPRWTTGALPDLPGRGPLGGHILSHDFVEAALLRRAGWRVEIAGDIVGSYEEAPPTVVDLAARDLEVKVLNRDRLAEALADVVEVEKAHTYSIVDCRLQIAD